MAGAVEPCEPNRSRRTCIQLVLLPNLILNVEDRSTPNNPLFRMTEDFVEPGQAKLTLARGSSPRSFSMMLIA